MVNISSSIHKRLQNFTKEKCLIDELFAYTQNSFVQQPLLPIYQKLEDEPQVATWEKYIQEAEDIGIYETLKKYLVQFQFPIKKDISQTEDYRNATLKGGTTVFMQSATGLFLNEPENLQLYLHPSIAGKIPVLITSNRADFNTIIQALTARNEPRPLPDSMGAAMIQGLNNWDRLRTALQSSSKEFVLQHKSLYQDRIIVLSRIPYSNVAASAINLEQEDWLDKSLKIRLEHECAHYFTLRHFGKMSNNMHDEIIADYMGICSVLPHYNSKWFLQFIGLEQYPAFRAGGRMKNYLGKPPLSDDAFKILQTIVKNAAENLEQFDRKIGTPLNDMERRFRLIALCHLNLIEMADEDGVERLCQTYNNLQVKV